MKESEFLQAAAQSRRLPHCVLLVGRPEETLPLARQTAAALLCPNGAQPSCACGVCRRVRAGIHPDVGLLDKGESLISVEDVRELRASAFVAPLEADGKVYIVCHAQNMNAAAQNAALKILEEPPQGVRFLLLCENHSAMLETVRSRCMTVVLGGADEGERESGGDRGQAQAQAEEFAQALCADDELSLYLACMKLEKLKRQEAAAFFDEALELVRGAVRAALGVEKAADETREKLCALGVTRLCRIASILLSRRGDVDRNAGVAHLMGTISAQYYEI